VRLVAGVDVGNTTTEVVLAQAPAAGEAPVPLAWDRAPTRGRKGSRQSLLGAAVLVRRLEQRVGRRADLVVAAPLRAVDTRSVRLPQTPPPTGRLEVVRVGGATPGRAGTAVGRPRSVAEAPRGGTGSVVLMAPAGTGYLRTVSLTGAWLAAGADVRGLLLADDEGVLVSARLAAELPVVDEVDLAAVAEAPLVALEVRPPGHPLQDLADPISLSRLLRLHPDERGDAVAVAQTLGDASRGVVVAHVERVGPGSGSVGELVLRTGGARVRLGSGAAADLAALRVGAVSAWRAPAEDSGADREAGEPEPVDDLWLVELREVATSVASRIGPGTARELVVAALHAGPGQRVHPGDVLAQELGVPVDLVSSEAAAARAGALSTPGVRPDAVVVDLGGGTVDVIGDPGAPGEPSGKGEVVAAGAGEMLTAVTSALLGLPRGAADWVKRGSSARLEAPQVLLAEDGTRSFLDRPAAAGAVGSLVVPGPAGLLPFGGDLAPAEWRALRLRAKQRVLGDNVVRALRTLDPPPGRGADVLLAGGVAADEELVGLLRAQLGAMAVGRADVAGRLGHRYAVAYGLVLLATW
jgi:Diol dehydratase reactivase ATPase-like domain/DD-reactivating factor swiveling domain